jgi:hypothetical protein
MDSNNHKFIIDLIYKHGLIYFAMMETEVCDKDEDQFLVPSVTALFEAI